MALSRFRRTPLGSALLILLLPCHLRRAADIDVPVAPLDLALLPRHRARSALELHHEIADVDLPWTVRVTPACALASRSSHLRSAAAAGWISSRVREWNRRECGLGWAGLLEGFGLKEALLYIIGPVIRSVRPDPNPLTPFPTKPKYQSCYVARPLARNRSIRFQAGSGSGLVAAATGRMSPPPLSPAAPDSALRRPQLLTASRARVQRRVPPLPRCRARSSSPSISLCCAFLSFWLCTTLTT